MPCRPHRLIPLFLAVAACTSTGVAPRDPASPTPVADPRAGPAAAGSGTQGVTDAEAGAGREVAVRPDQAPLVRVQEALDERGLLRKRVRVSGRCVARGEGRRAGSWTLEQAGATIEVRGLVPSSCARGDGEDVTIFAQIEPKSAGSPERILLRLPD
jgi:hypothetical protein